jgi:hypothetical protein
MPCHGAARNGRTRSNAAACCDPLPDPRVPPAGPARVIADRAARPASLPIETAAALPSAPVSAAPCGTRVVDIVSGPLQVRLAETDADIDAALALRYRIFYDIMGARPVEGAE